MTEPTNNPLQSHPTNTQLHNHLINKRTSLPAPLFSQLDTILASPLLSHPHLKFIAILFEIPTPSYIFYPLSKDESNIQPFTISLEESDLLSLHETFGDVAKKFLQGFVKEGLGIEKGKKEGLDREARAMVGVIESAYREVKRVRELIGGMEEEAGKGKRKLKGKVKIEYGCKGYGEYRALTEELGRRRKDWEERRADLEGIRDRIDVVRLNLVLLRDLEERFERL